MGKNNMQQLVLFIFHIYLDPFLSLSPSLSFSVCGGANTLVLACFGIQQFRAIPVRIGLPNQ